MLWRLFFFAGACGLALLIGGCGDKDVPYAERPLHTIYDDGVTKLLKGDFEEASSEFNQVEQQYPYSDWAPKAQLMSGYSLYMAGKYERAIRIFENVTYLHPYHPNADYAHYMIALCYFEQVGAPDRDAKLAENAFDAYKVVWGRYPQTKYGKDAIQKLQNLYDHLGAHHLEVGRYYQRKKRWIAAIKSFKLLEERFAQSIYRPEALYRMVESSLALGLIREAKRTQARLKKDFPQSDWTKDGEALLNALPQGLRSV